MTSAEFSAYDHLNRSLRLWWLVALAAILGGLSGFTLYHLRPPLYEATATYLVTIDLDRLPIQGMQADLVQYNEDLAVNTTQSVLLSDEVLGKVISQAEPTGTAISAFDLLHYYTIERKHETWELRYRNHDPQAAQSIVNLWAGIGYQTMQSWQSAGQIPNYVEFHSPTQAILPREPVYYDRNKVVLAGVLIGFIVGILFANLAGRAPKVAQPNNELV